MNIRFDQADMSSQLIYQQAAGLQKHTRIYLLSITNAACSLLTMTTGKLVSNLWRFHCPYTDLTELVALLVDGHHYLCAGNNEIYENIIHTDTTNLFRTKK